MDWNGTFPPFVSRPEPSLNFLCNYNHDHYNPGVEVKRQGFTEADNGLVPVANKDNNRDKKKKKLTSEQLVSLERSFQEENKLDPNRKMKLSRELGLQPRQVSVWFQNRGARWKAKQLEHSYATLKQDYDVISMEKQKLQDEVMKLKGMLMEQKARNQAVSTFYTEISGEEAVESTSNKPMPSETMIFPLLTAAIFSMWRSITQFHPPTGVFKSLLIPKYLL
ncbi:Homeobox-leucine zipper protein ATHB-22 [Hibiscus syriacus]|uniref:Homeobox-leucine zipper protein n=1 Tax=Hibiscus syriacus TaxID=106335 RepID=A0A6A3A0X9_HIBSY|nr:Homeobox-leucine zipper protein ATHB-22 [Hibiscus syriacus]